MVRPTRTVGKQYAASQNTIRPIGIAALPQKIEARTGAVEKSRLIKEILVNNVSCSA